MDFAVKFEDEDVGRWVLFVDPIGERFLIDDPENAFRWVPMANCRLLTAKNPDMPLPVVVVNQKPKITVPSLQLGDGPQGSNGR